MIDSSDGLEHVDVAIVGGGLVGSALTAAIASDARSQGLSIALFDPSPPALDALPPTSLRTSTITPSSKDFLDEISVWSKLPPKRIAPFHEMLIWDSPRGSTFDEPLAGAIRFDASMSGTSELGHVLDNDTLRHAIFQRICEQPDVRVIPSAIRGVDFSSDDANWPVLRMENDGMIATRLLVACDGARSRIRTLADMQWHQRPYGLCAVVATVETDAPITTAYQRFLSTGPLAVLPLADGTDTPLANIVWTTTTPEARALNATDDDVFIEELNAALRDDEDAPPGQTGGTPADQPDDRAARAWAATSRLSGAPGLHASLPRFASVRGSRGHFPLHWGHAPRYVNARKRTVLVGDAAHNVHPLAGQGVNLGFADARALADAVGKAAADGRDFGGEDGAPLMGYQAQRLPANAGMLGLLNSVQWLFDTNSPAIVRDLRRVGMSMLDTLAPAKRSILRLMR